MSPDPTTVAGEPGPRSRRSWPQRLLLTVGVLLSVTTLAAAAVVGWGAWKLGSIDRTDVSLDSVEGGPRNYLIVGSDTRSGGDPNDPRARDDHKPLADTIMVLRIDPATRQAMMLSLPRDLWLTLSGSGGKGRINAAYAEGHQHLIDTLRTELDIPINHYLEVDFKGFQQVVTAIDGVPMWFDRAMRDRNSGLDVLHPGCTNLDGYGALAFARARHLEYYENGGFEYDGTGDLGRISRQQVFIRRVISRAKSKGIHNPLTLKRLVEVGTANVTIDDQLTMTELLGLGKRFGDFDPDELRTYTLPTSPRTTSGGAKVEELDRADAEPLLALFRDPEPTITGDGGTSSSTSPGTPVSLLDPGDVDVSVYNSSGQQGLAVEVADDLVATGFTVSRWGNGGELDHEIEAHSVVRHAPGHEAEARTMAARIEGGADVVEDASIDERTVALFLGGDYTGLVSGPVTSSTASPSTTGSATSSTVTGPSTVTGSTPSASPSTTTPTSTPSTTSPRSTTTTVPSSSEVVGMVPLGDPPPGRECG